MANPDQVDVETTVVLLDNGCVAWGNDSWTLDEEEERTFGATSSPSSPSIHEQIFGAPERIEVEEDDEEEMEELEEAENEGLPSRVLEALGRRYGHGVPDGNPTPRRGDIVRVINCPGEACIHHGSICSYRQDGTENRIDRISDGMASLNDSGTCPVEYLQVVRRPARVEGMQPEDEDGEPCPNCGRATCTSCNVCHACEHDERERGTTGYVGEDGEEYFGASPDRPVAGSTGFAPDNATNPDIEEGTLVQVDCRRANGRECPYGGCTDRHGTTTRIAARRRDPTGRDEVCWVLEDGGYCPGDALIVIPEEEEEEPEDSGFEEEEEEEDRPTLYEGMWVRINCVKVRTGHCQHGSCIDRHGQRFQLRDQQPGTSGCWRVAGGYCPEIALIPEEEWDEIEEDDMAVRMARRPVKKKAAKKKKVAKKKPVKKKAVSMRDIEITDDTIAEVAGRLAKRMKEPRDIKAAVRWVERNGSIMTRIKDLADAIEHYKSDSDDKYKYLMNICELVPRVYRDTGSINHSELTHAREFLKSADMNIDREDMLRMQLTGLLKNFRKAVYSPKDNKINVETEDCFAKNICFGPFRIGYWVDTGHLRLNALEPNEPHKGMVHPHVDRDGGDICLGNGRNAFQKSVRDFRICDALLIVRGVLNEYGGNPHHDIGNWKETQRSSCVTCGRDSGTGFHTCRGCRKLVCTEHAFQCSRCGSITCHEHIRKCRDCGNAICGPCRREEKVCGHCKKKLRQDVKWQEKVEKCKEIVPKVKEGARVKKQPKSDKERLGGGFIK
jgi:hypothetical protein